jgi:hypothetical protein
MSGIPFGSPKLAVELTYRNLRVTAMIVLNPFQFLGGMSIWMCGMRLVGFID